MMPISDVMVNAASLNIKCETRLLSPSLSWRISELDLDQLSLTGRRFLRLAAKLNRLGVRYFLPFD